MTCECIAQAESEREERLQEEREKEAERECDRLIDEVRDEVRQQLGWQHWPAGQPHSIVKVRDEGVMAVLQELLNGTGIGDGGRDQQQHGTFLYPCPVECN